MAAEEERLIRTAIQAKYYNSPKGRTTRQHYLQRPEVIEAIREQSKSRDRSKYNNSAEGKASREKYNKSPKGQAARNRYEHGGSRQRFEESLEGTVAILLKDARTRAKKKNLSFSITREMIADRFTSCNNACQQTGDLFDFAKHKRRNPYRPSLDQIIAGKGYTPDNFQLVTYQYNCFKNDRSDEEAMTAWRNAKFLENKKGASVTFKATVRSAPVVMADILVAHARVRS